MAPLVVAFALLQGCVPQPQTTQVPSDGPITTISQIKINGVQYPSEQAALATIHGNDAAILAQLATEPDPVTGRALIVLPDHDRLRPFEAQQQNVALKRVVTGQALDLFIDLTQKNLHELADAVVKNGAFQSVTVEERNDVLNPDSTDADFVIWYQVKTILPNNIGAWVGLWQVRRRGNLGTQGANLDPGTPAGAPRLVSFVKSVREASLRLGGNTVGGATAASIAGGAGATASPSTGSGIVVDKGGTILTNAHVVNICVGPHVVDFNNARYEARIVAQDQVNDLALLRVDHHWTEIAGFGDGSDLRPGNNVVAVGYPLTGLVTSSAVVTTGTISALSGPRDDSRLFQISAPIQPGNSGGPVLDNEGRVTGIVTSELNGVLLMLLAGISPQNVNFALKPLIIRNFLESQGIEFTQAAAAKDISAATIGAQARKFTVRVECNR